MVALTQQHRFGTLLVAGFVVLGVLSALWH
jgi:hypothetical protein